MVDDGAARRAGADEVARTMSLEISEKFAGFVRGVPRLLKRPAVNALEGRVHSPLGISTALHLDETP